MSAHVVDEETRLSFWSSVRRFAVPPLMIETASARRRVGDWAGACAAAGIDVEFRLRSVARAHGSELAARVRADLRRLAPDLLRWHMPRIAPDGLLRPGLTTTLARYGTEGRAGPVHLVARTPPAWADGGQRIALALWDGSASSYGAAAGRHPHPRPDRRFRLDLHRHLWDAHRADELGVRAGYGAAPTAGPPGAAPPESHWAVARWAAEAAILLRAEGLSAGRVTVRLGPRQRLDLDVAAEGDGPPVLRTAAVAPARGGSAGPVLPDAATWVLPDLELLRAGLIEPGALHPLVASALVPDHVVPPPASGPPDPAGRPRLVQCRGATHRIGLVGGVLTALDHDPAELRREELLAALTGTPLPCLQEIDRAHRRPDWLPDVRARLDHGDTAGALAVVEDLLGPAALLRDGALRDELEAAARRRITYGLFRAGLTDPGPGLPIPAAFLRPSPGPAPRRDRPNRRRPSPYHRSHPRQAAFR
ncbi:hypothetical protein [Actinacidiphila acididurans]|uniref:Uncharacterized protein n=1 Tax=Actinacidiphila acididurans TaxID=2784346 RepID=A0ABS2TPK7_9ACTN|nr:hypothetical protein [Actinacidiphila acididurans]MBM9505266.1 hypothetical protein [Actinacidiphila acididurans]